MAYNSQYPDNSSNENTYKTARYNSMQAIIFRIDLLTQQYHQLLCAGKMIAANWVLDRVWGELSADAKESDLIKFKEFMAKISEAKKTNNKSKLYLILLEKEHFIRVLQNKQGKGTSYEEGVEDYME